MKMRFNCVDGESHTLAFSSAPTHIRFPGLIYLPENSHHVVVRYVRPHLQLVPCSVY